MKGKRILIISDRSKLPNLLRKNLEEYGYAVAIVSNAFYGRVKIFSEEYSLLVIDAEVSSGVGLAICREYRSREQIAPIVIISSSDNEQDKILAFEQGADDFLTVPFAVSELIARIGVLIRREAFYLARYSTDIPKDRRLFFESLMIDPDRRRVISGKEALSMTRKEFDLLYFLAKHPGKAFSRESLIQHVWHYRNAGYSHTVSAHINRIRAKIETDPKNPAYIKTVWGFGYRFARKEELDFKAAKSA